MTYKPKQLRLLFEPEPIRDSDALSIDTLMTRYRDHCGNTTETGIKLKAVTVRSAARRRKQPYERRQLNDQRGDHAARRQSFLGESAVDKWQAQAHQKRPSHLRRLALGLMNVSQLLANF